MISHDRMTQRRLARQYDERQAQFDSIDPKQAADQLEVSRINERMAIAATSQMRLQSLSVVFMLASMLSETDYDDDEMLPSELLDSLMLEAFSDGDDEDDVDEIDEKVKTVFSAHVSDALSTLGVSDDIIEDLFDTDTEIADAAVTSASETVLDNMPDDGKDFDEFVTAFAYGDDGSESSYDDMDGDDDDDEDEDEDEDEEQYDAAGKKKLAVGKKSSRTINGKKLRYKAVAAMRKGKKVIVNKRISGTARLTAGQKAGLKKAQKKAQAPRVIKQAMRSLKKGISRNVYKGNPKRLAALAGANKSRSKRPPRMK